MLIKRIITAAAAVALVAGGGLAVSAPAQAAVMGETIVELRADVTAKALKDNVGVYVTELGGSSLNDLGKLVIAFPITNVNASKGLVSHQGTLLFAHNYYGSQRTVELRNLRIDTTKKVITAGVALNGSFQGRLTVFTISGGVDRDGDLINVKVNLASGVAGVVNKALGINFLVDKMRLGAADVVFIDG